MRFVLIGVTAVVLATVAACGGDGSGGSTPPTPPPPPSTPPIVPTGGPVETRAPNAVQTPAFTNQTRAPGQRTTRMTAFAVVASGLVNPWALEMLPDGRWLVTERQGRMRIVTAQGAIGAPITGLPPVLAQGQGGLLDVALSPGFSSDRLIYWSYAEARTGGSGTTVARARLSADDTRLEAVELVFRAVPTVGGTGHYGSRLIFDRTGRLYISLGDRQDNPANGRVQALDTYFGKVARINADGSTPSDNPFLTQPGALPGLYSRGHRNPQGATLHPTTGELWTIEHGPQGGDELNVVRSGRNYGWPEVSYGEDYDGTPIGAGVTTRPGIEQPVYFWDPVIAPGGMTFYAGTMFPEWSGHLLIAALAQQHLVRLEIVNDRVVGEERLLTGLNARLRDVAIAGDGAVWVITDETNGRLVRLSAA